MKFAFERPMHKITQITHTEQKLFTASAMMPLTASKSVHAHSLHLFFSMTGFFDKTAAYDLTFTDDI